MSEKLFDKKLKNELIKRGIDIEFTVHYSLLTDTMTIDYKYYSLKIEQFIYKSIELDKFIENIIDRICYDFLRLQDL